MRITNFEGLHGIIKFSVSVSVYALISDNRMLEHHRQIVHLDIHKHVECRTKNADGPKAPQA